MAEQLFNRIELAPHCSLSVRGAHVFFGGLVAVSFGIAGVFAIQGFWPVLPFAGLEMLVLAWALWASFARRRFSEAITISERDVLIELCDRERRSQIVFSRHWAQVKLRSPVSRLHPSRLTIESHGRALEVGRFLTEEERRGLAMRLQRLIGRVNESPSLA
ncbi:MAG: DUF2244 domain-containing protein [Gammaproteobacteria bacterium]